MGGRPCVLRCGRLTPLSHARTSSGATSPLGTAALPTAWRSRLDGMRAVIGEILPLSVGIAIGPLAIIAAVLMLLSPQARSTRLGFLAGWVIGITVAVVSFT